MKNLVLFLVLIAFPFAIQAQSTVLESGTEEETAVPDQKILVIPFHTLRYYFSDCDKNIADASMQEVPDVRKSMMLGLDYATEHKFEKKYEPMNLVQMRDSIDKEYMKHFYDNVSYAYEAPIRPLEKKQLGALQRVKGNIKKIGSNEKEEKTLNEEDTYTKIETPNDDKYMQLNWKNQEFFDALVTTYEPDMIVTINQFEIKTDFAHCIDRDLGKYSRLIKVHYNVFDKEGKLKYGDVVTARYDSRSDDINRIIQDNFGFLAEYIMKSLPSK